MFASDNFLNLKKEINNTKNAATITGQFPNLA